MKSNLIKSVEHVIAHLQKYPELIVSIDNGTHARARTICKTLANDGVLDVQVVKGNFIYILAKG